MDFKRLLVLTLFMSFAFVGTACGPKYPKCKTDNHCQKAEMGKVEGKLFCVNGLCQQCKEDADCGDPSLECNAGVCDTIPGYCASVDDCPGNQKCRDNRCGPECLEDGDCGDGMRCEGGSCVADAECSSNADCPDGNRCESGKCIAASGDCYLDPVYFAYDSSTLDDSARSTLQANASCMKERGLSVQVEGHCDERGTSEYNLALGERRATAAYKYLRGLNVSKDDITTITYGEERLKQTCGEEGPESCHRANRRVEMVTR